MSKEQIVSSIQPGSHLVKYCGDAFSITLKTPKNLDGKAFLRTNINQADIRQSEIIAHTELDAPYFDRGWCDMEMNSIAANEYEIVLPLIHPGHYGAKPYFQKADGSILWLDGDNIVINIESNMSRFGNSIYCAFPRQFGKNMKLAESPNHDDLKAMDEQGYTVIPPSGTFRDLISKLDHIFDTLSCKILHLLPINPTPTTYARMGRYGSPYAALDFTAINPELCEFDLHKTPLQQFSELVDEVHKRSGRLVIDIAINHTGWASKIHETNPEWVKRHPDGKIFQPGAWGTTWEDLTELSHSDKSLWSYLAEVFLTWCERGVDGFRCDAGYMIPEAAWKYIVARVRRHYPETIFLLEGLGGPWETTERMLDHCNINWAYSELFQNYSKHEISNYLKYSSHVSNSFGTMVHYAETHDNMRLAAKSQTWAKMRTQLSALLSHNGSFGFTNGVEWYAEEKIDVHSASALNWGSDTNMIAEIKQLNSLLEDHPAFHEGSQLNELYASNDQVIAFERVSIDKTSEVTVVINLNADHDVQTGIHLPEDSKLSLVYDLLNGGEYEVHDKTVKLDLKAGEALCFGEKTDLISNNTFRNIHRASLSASEILYTAKKDFDPRENKMIAAKFIANPLKWLKSQNLIPTIWQYPSDLDRHVPCPVGSCFVIRAHERFRAKVFGILRESFQATDGQHYIVTPPIEDAEEIRFEDLKIELFGEHTEHHTSQILRLTTEDVAYKGKHPANHTFNCALDTNGRGAMMRLPHGVSDLWSRYDALLAANISPDYPENRHIMWRRCRIYVSYNHHTYELNSKTFEKSEGQAGSTKLTYRVPCGTGLYARFQIQAFMVPDKNATRFVLKRLKSDNEDYLEDDDKMTAFLRVDLEDRDFHSDTKAGNGLESFWSGKLKEAKQGLVFQPCETRTLHIDTSKGKFVREEEWCYNEFNPNEAARGLQAHNDLFSPGYFKAKISGGEDVILTGELVRKDEEKSPEALSYFPETKEFESYRDSLIEAVKHYVVARDGMKTVIAGYPWFLDWGRDTLICTRGLISAGYTDDVKKILVRFATFEEDGTLPNSIHGADLGNRETSDAPLWFFSACQDYMDHQGNSDLLDEDCGGRSIKEIMISIAENYLKGTPNGLKADTESKLIYSPSHYTWMDTNYPAGTARKGYPVEIQALWIRALAILHKNTQEEKWADLRKEAQKSFMTYFWNEQRGYLSDCLHCDGFAPAAQADADDALRSNQIFAVTLDAVEDESIEAAIIEASSCLLIPGAIRSLANRPVDRELPVYSDQGHLLNDPKKPYHPHYEGDEDTRRKPAYHNGTAWGWPFPSYAEALLKLYGEDAKETVVSLLYSSRVLFDTGCVGQLPEVLDGSAPHTPRGCDSQAWSVTELIRVLSLV